MKNQNWQFKSPWLKFIYEVKKNKYLTETEKLTKIFNFKGPELFWAHFFIPNSQIYYIAPREAYPAYGDRKPAPATASRLGYWVDDITYYATRKLFLL